MIELEKWYEKLMWILSCLTNRIRIRRQ